MTTEIRSQGIGVSSIAAQVNGAPQKSRAPTKTPHEMPPRTGNEDVYTATDPAGKTGWPTKVQAQAGPTLVPATKGAAFKVQPGKRGVAELQSKLASFPTRQELRDKLYKKATSMGYPGADHRPDAERGIASAAARKKMAAEMKKLQQDWATLSEADRKSRVAAILNERLKADGVPPISIELDATRIAKGTLEPKTWSLKTSLPKTLDDKEAADLLDTFAHEGYHAEQMFLMARFALVMNAPPSGLKATMSGHVVDAAKQANGTPLTASQTTLAETLWTHSRQAGGMDAHNLRTGASFKEYQARQSEAKAALEALKKRPSRETIEKAKSLLREIEKAKANVERDYDQYRRFSYEADAHLVGGAAAEAFNQLK